jgi:hypothetical protein
MRTIKIISLSILLAFCVQFPAQAQETQDCKIDLSEANALMAQAQSKSAAGDISEALALLDQVQQKLAEIQTRCGETGVPPLLAKYVDPADVFSVNYPNGWLTQSLADTPAEQQLGRPILFASDPAAFDMIANPKPDVNSRGVVVYVGNSKDLMKQLGVREESKVINPLNPKTLLDTIVQGQSSGDGKFGTVTQGAAIRDFATAEAPFTIFDKESKAVAEGSVLLMQLGADRFAVLVGFAPPGNSKSIAALTHAMAATLQAPAKTIQ